MKNLIIANNGSIQAIPSIPDDIKAIYKTVWEISQKKVLDLAADRGAFICQSQSLNVHLQSPTVGQLTSMHFYGWKKGLKTGMYYLRTRPAAQAIQFTIDPTLKMAQAQLTQSPQQQQQQQSQIRSSPSVRQNLFSNSTPSSPSKLPSLASSATLNSSTSSLKTAYSANGSAAPPSLAAATSLAEGLNDLSLDEKTRKAAEEDPEFAAALKRQKDRELEEAKLMCSLENKEACLMCSG